MQLHSCQELPLDFFVGLDTTSSLSAEILVWDWPSTGKSQGLKQPVKLLSSASWSAWYMKRFLPDCSIRKSQHWVLFLGFSSRTKPETKVKHYKILHSLSSTNFEKRLKTILMTSLPKFVPMKRSTRFRLEGAEMFARKLIFRWKTHTSWTYYQVKKSIKVKGVICFYPWKSTFFSDLMINSLVNRISFTVTQSKVCVTDEWTIPQITHESVGLK